MGGMDGIATLQELRKLDEDLPVIILTGHGTPADAAAGIGLEIVDFLQKPVDVDELALHIRELLSRGGQPLREKSLAELIVPVGSYQRVYADEPLQSWVRALRESLFQHVAGHVTQRGHRSVLVYERDEQFLGMLRLPDLIRGLIPTYLRDNPYASAFTGMFLAQTKVMGRMKIRELVDAREPLDIGAPLMAAALLMYRRGVFNLPIARDGHVVGVLRDKDLLLEIARQMPGT
jgi:CheY-like chemotaxis protein